MSIPGSSIKAARGLGPMMVMGVTKREFRTSFKSQKIFSDKAYTISGVTKDSTGAVLSDCVVDLFYTDDKMKAASVRSDANGSFSFSIGPSLACYIVAYKAGSPDVSGTTVNTLVAV